MTQGFEDWYQDNEFSIESKTDARSAYEAGAVSQQQEVDKLQAELEVLQGMYNAVSLTAGELVDERDVLQKRIDEAWNELDERNSKEYIIEMVEKTLKGE